MTETVIELPEELRDPLRRKLNQAVMRTWINEDRLTRASYDIRTSIALYDSDGVFVSATHKLPEAEALEALYRDTSLRYYSKGV